MTALSLRLPESLHRKLAEVAERDGVSINQWISSAVAEKMSALMTEEYLEAHARRGSKRRFAAVLAKVANAEPDEPDRASAPDANLDAKVRPMAKRTIKSAAGTSSVSVEETLWLPRAASTVTEGVVA